MGHNYMVTDPMGIPMGAYGRAVPIGEAMGILPREDYTGITPPSVHRITRLVAPSSLYYQQNGADIMSLRYTW